MTMDPRIEKLAGELIALPLAELSAGEITERIAVRSLFRLARKFAQLLVENLKHVPIH
jgi:hypothetical protein